METFNLYGFKDVRDKTGAAGAWTTINQLLYDFDRKKIAKAIEDYKATQETAFQNIKWKNHNFLLDRIKYLWEREGASPELIEIRLGIEKDKFVEEDAFSREKFHERYKGTNILNFEKYLAAVVIAKTQTDYKYYRMQYLKRDLAKHDKKRADSLQFVPMVEPKDPELKSTQEIHDYIKQKLYSYYEKKSLEEVAKEELPPTETLGV